MLVTSAMLIAAISVAPAPQAPVASVDVDATAIAVVRGDYGTGEERRARLGADYDVVQSRVNELLDAVGYTVDYVEPETVAPAVVPEPVQTEPVPVETVSEPPAVESVQTEAEQVGPQSYTVEDIYDLAMSEDMPMCMLEDGSDRPMCYWHDENTGIDSPSVDIVYMPDGYGYQVTGDTTVSVFQRNTWE
ncbi:lysozyme [Bifidobacterium sp. SO1]|uniref:lysozyme n=1 Tax=Bifidobacterium sp. SO1 TaxID=2809029 RepID=UPI001BDD3047|nr:lysozyme [Bifidobacterium sp. SO1]MBT1161230.1 lysozyme [Bifidobacterium sp. SO1]